jgi:hypothetical protein
MFLFVWELKNLFSTQKHVSITKRNRNYFKCVMVLIIEIKDKIYNIYVFWNFLIG